MAFARLTVERNRAASQNARVRQIVVATASVMAVVGGAKPRVALKPTVGEATARLTAGARSVLFQAAMTGPLGAVCVHSTKCLVLPPLSQCDVDCCVEEQAWPITSIASVRLLCISS